MAYERGDHHTVANTCQVKGRDTSGRPVAIRVHGRASVVRARIESRINAGAQRMDFEDVTTGRTVTVSLAAGDKVAVK